MINDTLNNIDFSTLFDIFSNFSDDCKIKKFRRKFRQNGKITYSKYLCTYNPVNDLFLDNLSFSLKRINTLLKKY